MRKILATAVALILFSTATAAGQTQPFAAYLEAEGWGWQAGVTCDRTTTHYIEVTNTNDTGAGSFNAALNTAETLPENEMKYVVFETGGWTFGSYAGSFACTYIAGQSAPGGGFGLHTGRHLRFVGTPSHDIILRGLTFTGRARDSDTSVPDATFQSVSRFMYAENTCLWWTEKCFTLGPLSDDDVVQDVTIQQVIFAEANGLESTAVQMSRSEVATNTVLRRVSWGRDVFHTVSHRNPVAGCSDDSANPCARFSGILWYNTANQANIQGGGKIDVVDSKHVAGPMTTFNPGGRDYSWLISAYCTGTNNQARVHSWYLDRVAGNHADSTVDVEDMFWAEIDRGTDGVADSVTAEASCYYRSGRDPDGGGDIRDSLDVDPIRTSPMTSSELPSVPLRRFLPSQVEAELIGSTDADITVGAHWELQCDGTRQVRIDSALSEMAQKIRDRVGIGNPANVDSQYVAPKVLYPKALGSPCPDSDGDGLPDAFEKVASGDPNDSTSVTREDDPDGDGYIAMDEYLNATDPDSANTTGPTGGGGGGGNGGGGGTATYGDGRIIHLVPTVPDTLIYNGGADTLITQAPDPDSVPKGAYCFTIPDPDLSHVYVATYDVLSPQPAVLDSAAVADSMAQIGTARDPRMDPCFGQ